MTVNIHNGLPAEALYFSGYGSDGAHCLSGKLPLETVHTEKNGMGADHYMNICFDQKMGEDNSTFTFLLSPTLSKGSGISRTVMVDAETVTFSNAPYGDPQSASPNPTFLGSQEYRIVSAGLMHNSKTCDDKSCLIEVDYSQ